MTAILIGIAVALARVATSATLPRPPPTPLPRAAAEPHPPVTRASPTDCDTSLAPITGIGRLAGRWQTR